MEGLSATLTLISAVIKSVDQNVLQAKFGPVSKLLLENLAKFAGDEMEAEAEKVRPKICCFFENLTVSYFTVTA